MWWSSSSSVRRLPSKAQQRALAARILARSLLSPASLVGSKAKLGGKVGAESSESQLDPTRDAAPQPFELQMRCSLYFLWLINKQPPRGPGSSIYRRPKPPNCPTWRWSPARSFGRFVPGKGGLAQGRSRTEHRNQTRVPGLFICYHGACRRLPLL